MESRLKRHNVLYRFLLTITILAAVIGLVTPFPWPLYTGSESAAEDPTARDLNEIERSAYAAITGILGRMAGESGKLVTWEEAIASDLELAPGLEHMTAESEPLVKPDAAGNYPIAMPGRTEAV